MKTINQAPRTAPKKAYTTPALLARDVRFAAQNVCGWWTACGKQVQYRS